MESVGRISRVGRRTHIRRRKNELLPDRWSNGRAYCAHRSTRANLGVGVCLAQRWNTSPIPQMFTRSNYPNRLDIVKSDIMGALISRDAARPEEGAAPEADSDSPREEGREEEEEEEEEEGVGGGDREKKKQKKKTSTGVDPSVGVAAAAGAIVGGIGRDFMPSISVGRCRSFAYHVSLLRGCLGQSRGLPVSLT